MTSSWSWASGASDSTASATCCSCTAASGISPRFRRALPPSAMTMRTSVSEGGDHDRLDRVQAVLGLVEHDRARRLEHLVGNLERVPARALDDLLAHSGVAVGVGGQAVHEADLRVAGGRSEAHKSEHKS